LGQKQQMKAVTYKADTSDGDKRNLNKLREGAEFARRLSLCQVNGPLYYSTEAKLCPTVKLIAATVCRTALAVYTGPSRSGIGRQTSTSLYQWRNSTEGTIKLSGSRWTEASTYTLVVRCDLTRLSGVNIYCSFKTKILSFLQRESCLLYCSSASQRAVDRKNMEAEVWKIKQPIAQPEKVR
jgi:hypothetical protein